MANRITTFDSRSRLIGALSRAEVEGGASPYGAPDLETVNCNGESIHEDKNVISVEEPAKLSVKGHFSQEDGLVAGVVAATATAQSGESLAGQTA